MVGMRALAALIALAGVAPAWGAEPDEGPDEGYVACYDVAVIGRFIDSDDFVSLADLMPVKDPPEGEDVIYLGGRADIRVRVELASGSLSVPAHVMRLQAMVEALPVRNSAVLFHVQKLPDGRWFAIDWSFSHKDWRGRYRIDNDGEPPRCRADSQRIVLK